MSLIYNATFDKNTRKLSFEDRAGNEVYSFTVPERTPAVDDVTKPLTFKATQDGSTVKLTKNNSPSGSFQTSRDGGNTWVDYTIDDAITLNTGDEVSFRAKYDRTSAQSDKVYFYFMMEGKIESWHNVMSLYRTSDFATYESVVEYAFYRLFYNCTSLTKAPALPATTFAEGCYASMFYGCQSLTEAPELPVTTLAEFCYGNMFRDCSSLTKAPVLPATTLTVSCYYQMFLGCRSLTKAPALPATTLVRYCYGAMFYGCQSLKEVRVSATTTATGATNALNNWLYGVSATGDFYCDPNATIFPTGASGIPSGWRRIPPVDDRTKPLTFRATQDNSSVKLTKMGTPSGDFQTSTDGGKTWTDYTLDTAISLNTGGEVSFRAKSDRSAQTAYDFFFFNMTGKIEAWHNVMSMYRTNDFATYNTTPGTDTFNSLFNGCTSLTKAPVLPATTITDSCYYSMFANTSITKAPELPATTLDRWCYANMFSGCSSLTKAPELPATTLADTCYQGMFSGCSSLTKAPELPATTLAPNCYHDMFNFCQSLKEVRISATKTASRALNNWLSGVSATGDFYCDPAATIFPTGASGIPANWTRRNIADYPVTP